MYLSLGGKKMSICLYGRISKKCLDTEGLEKMIRQFFSSKPTFVKHFDEQYVSFEGLDEKNNISISFIQDKGGPYNVYDSDIIDSEFFYQQLLIFELSKDDISISMYKNIFRFLEYVRSAINCDILVTSDVHDEICLLEKQNIIWSKTAPEGLKN